MGGLTGAIGLLTRLPVPRPPAATSGLTRAVPWFPVVGAGVGAIVGLVRWGMGLIAPPAISSLAAVAVGIAITGALHEDGLADVFDAVGAGGGREQAFSALDDPRVGTFGAVALMMSIAVRSAALASIPGTTALLVAPAAHAVARGAAVGLMGIDSPARGGLGAVYATGLTPSRTLAGVAASAVVGFGLLGFALLPGLMAAVTGGVWVVLWARRVLGGFTGDVLGAVEQITEVGVLVALATHPALHLIPW